MYLCSSADGFLDEPFAGGEVVGDVVGGAELAAGDAGHFGAGGLVGLRGRGGGDRGEVR